ncbi:MAG: hypothetical protein EXR72_15530 [Myxococcales bacterium]|nr:hypothetical protein [Myxococcales bacterium]
MKNTLLLLLTLLAGCNKNPYFSDDEGAPRPGSSVGEHPDELSTPYALGTKVNIAIKQIDASEAATFQFKSDNPSVLSIDQMIAKDGQLSALCSATGEGETRLHLLDGKGGEARSAAVSVRAPDRARLFAHGPLRILGREESQLAAAEVKEARVLVGGKAVFAVAYYRSDQRLYGRGILKTEQAPTVKPEVQTTGGVVTNEWLFVSPSMAGTSDLTLKVGTATLLTVPLVAVPEADIEALTLGEEVTEKRNDKQAIWLLAEVRDAAGRPVHGVYLDWTLAGAAQTGKDNPKVTSGDLYRYQINPSGTAQELTATRGGRKASASIKAHKGWVENTTYLGCSAGGRRGGTLPALAMLVLALALACRRRA